jgi:hypothetical protein
MPQLLTMKNPTAGSGDGSLIWQPNARDGAGNQLLMGYPRLASARAAAWHQG